LSPVKLASVLAKIYPSDDLVGMACPVRLRTAFRARTYIRLYYGLIY
jgi:hypothetical protein